MNVGEKTEEVIFKAAIRLKSPAERVAYVRRACGSDADLHTRLNILLQAHDEAGDFLETPPLDLDVALQSSPVSEGPSTVIGRYRLLERIGEGGMAVVYMAEQTQPIRRKVAFKIIKLGMDTRQVIARFEAERQALALMDHPNIAKVFDAGATETGRPYFVMELVTGVSITKYCDRNSLSTRDRLGLFIQVCHAVQHAHQKGIIHRDIKPSNVMVTMHDGEPVPKVIDFGIAKATNQKLTEKTLFTRYAHLIGTPAYMSPEQAELSDLDVDTRSDVYSLGVLLYELLTGATPFSEEELRKAGYIEMQRVIREEEPAKPSTKLSTLGETLTDVAKHRNSSPDVLARSIRGDLDWIVMKSLEKDRARRYETANGLAEDIRRHLEHEPVLARGPSATYRLRKFLRRHRVPTLAAAAMAIVGSVVIIILSMWNRDRLQLVEAEGFRDRGVLSQAHEQYARADREAALETIKPILNSRHVGPEAHLLHAGILVDNRRREEAVAVLEDLLDKQPEIAGAAHSLLARILWESTSPDAERLQEIEEHRQKAEGLLPETAEAYFLRAMTAVTVKEQLASLDRALQLDPGHYESRRLRAFTYYASRKYDRLRDDALVMTVLRARDPLGYSLRAVAWRELGRYPEAIADYDNAMALTSPEDTEYLDLIAQRSEVFLRMGDCERAVAETQECLKLSPDNSILQHHMFCALTALGEYEKATALFRQIIAPGHEARRDFRDWCMKYVFDTLEAGRSWHPQDREPAGAAFLPMVEAEETYRSLSAKGRRVTTDGFSAQWSPDGKKLAFSLGVHGYSGVAIFDPATQETELLIVPGKDPRWSPDGQHIAFVRDCQLLRLAELAEAERSDQHRPVADEEVWLMKSDGTEPRRLAKGSWPSWGSDSEHLYYLSRGDNTLCSVSLIEQDTELKKIMKCSNYLPTVSPDNKHVSYFEGGSLKIRDLASQTLVAECRVPSLPWGNTVWSPTGNEVCLGGSNPAREETGLWIYGLLREEFARVLDGQVRSASWSPMGTDLVFCLGAPYRELWTAPIDPNIPTIEALGPAQTLDEHLDGMLAFYARRIEADPNDAYAYSSRAQYHDYLGDRASANADMRRWSAILNKAMPLDSSLGAPRDRRRVIHMPFDCEIVFSAERPVNEIPMMSVAFGQKGRCEMKLFEIPMFVTSLFGLCLLSGLDAPPAYADFTFGEPANLESVIPLIDPAHESINCFSSDGLEMYIASNRSGGQGDMDLWVLRRSSIDEDWGPPENLGPAVNSPQEDNVVSISGDGLTLLFWSYKRPGGYGHTDIYATTRPTRNAPWGQAVNMGPQINSSSPEAQAVMSADGLELYFSSWRRPGGFGNFDLWVTKRATTDGAWGEPVNLGPVVNSPYSEAYATLSPDGRVLFFAGNDFEATHLPGGYGGADIWMTRRQTLSDPWQAPVNLGSKVNSSKHEIWPCISPDGSTLYFTTKSGSTYENWLSPIIPIVDFNGNGKVDGKDLLAMIVEFGGSDPLCDIGPYAWGDGVVDFEDLKVLAEYIGQEVTDPTLTAYWPLDETDGITACDMAGENDATVVGGAVWQRDGGMVGGALGFDGVSSFAIAGAVRSLGDGPFSVLAWIKGGAPGQVVIAQQGGENWLYANPADGSLMTRLMGSAPSAQPGFSDVAITDGQWHRIALVWDGADRILHVDGEEVARDAPSGLTIPDKGLLIGCGKAMTPGTFFSGLIDDVRIYSRAVKP